MANKLTLNLSKSNMILIKPKNFNNKVKASNTTSNFVPKISTVNSSKYIGVLLYNYFTFEQRIKMLTNKLSKTVGILNKVKTYLSKSALLSLHCAFFYFQLYYGLLTWSSTFHSHYNKITTLQNKSIKHISGGKWSDRATPYYSKLKLRKLPDLTQSETAIFVFNFKNQKLASIFNNFFMPLYNTHVKNTRSKAANKYFSPFFKSKKLQRSIKFRGPKIWNSLESIIKNCKTIEAFKSKLKRSLLNTVITLLFRYIKLSASCLYLNLKCK